MNGSRLTSASWLSRRSASTGGRTVKNTGDGLLAEFASVVDAVRCAVEAARHGRARARGAGGAAGQVDGSNQVSPAPEGFYFQASGSLVTLPAAGYHYNMDWTPCVGGTLAQPSFDATSSMYSLPVAQAINFSAGSTFFELLGIASAHHRARPLRRNRGSSRRARQTGRAARHRRT